VSTLHLKQHQIEVQEAIALETQQAEQLDIQRVNISSIDNTYKVAKLKMRIAARKMQELRETVELSTRSVHMIQIRSQVLSVLMLNSLRNGLITVLSLQKQLQSFLSRQVLKSNYRRYSSERTG